MATAAADDTHGSNGLDVNVNVVDFETTSPKTTTTAAAEEEKQDSNGLDVNVNVVDFEATSSKATTTAAEEEKQESNGLDVNVDVVDFEATSLLEAKQKYEFFWKIPSAYSQFYPAALEVDGQTYSSAEQYMMHQKAVLFGDAEAASQIMSSNDPQFHKETGRNVQNFDVDKWTRERVAVVKRGNMAKFDQNEELKGLLFSTYPRTLVEASSEDAVWGIGHVEDEEGAWNRSTWRGLNLLGFALTDVRNDLMKQDGLLS